MQSLILGNIVVEYFIKGGPIMWPILITALTAVVATLDRIAWWSRLKLRRQPKEIESTLIALEAGNLEQAKALSDNTKDPILCTINSGLRRQHMSVRGALDMAIDMEMEGAARSLVVLDTTVTLAPLLGLLGTVTGIMKSFVSIGSEQLAVEKVTGGIGEALIATAAGLGIAIISLLALNYFNRKAEKFESQLERAANNLEMMVLHHNNESGD